jgi:hypothetical protein
MIIRQFADEIHADNDRADRLAEERARVAALKAEYERHLACDDWPDDADQSTEAKAKRRLLHHRGTIRLANMLEAMADLRKMQP